MTEIRIPTRILYGLTDVLVPRQHGEWLAHNVPNAEAVIDLPRLTTGVRQCSGMSPERGAGGFGYRRADQPEVLP